MSECNISDCENTAIWWIFKQGNGITMVCTQHRDDLIARGWVLGGTS